MVVLLMLNVKGAILIGIIATTLIGIPFGVTQLCRSASITFGTLRRLAFPSSASHSVRRSAAKGMGSLFRGLQQDFCLSL